MRVESAFTAVVKKVGIELAFWILICDRIPSVVLPMRGVCLYDLSFEVLFDLRPEVSCKILNRCSLMVIQSVNVYVVE